jgi:hypothetical protein
VVHKCEQYSHENPSIHAGSREKEEGKMRAMPVPEGAHQVGDGPSLQSILENEVGRGVYVKQR